MPTLLIKARRCYVAKPVSVGLGIGHHLFTKLPANPSCCDSARAAGAGAVTSAGRFRVNDCWSRIRRLADSATGEREVQEGKHDDTLHGRPPGRAVGPLPLSRTGGIGGPACSDYRSHIMLIRNASIAWAPRAAAISASPRRGAALSLYAVEAPVCPPPFPRLGFLLTAPWDPSRPKRYGADSSSSAGPSVSSAGDEARRKCPPRSAAEVPHCPACPGSGTAGNCPRRPSQASPAVIVSVCLSVAKGRQPGASS